MFLTLQWFSLMAAKAKPGATKLMLWVWGVFQSIILAGDEGAIAKLSQILAWSFKALFRGKWPKADWRNDPTLALCVSATKNMFKFEGYQTFQL